jgi:hypothetical protein
MNNRIPDVLNLLTDCPKYFSIGTIARQCGVRPADVIKVANLCEAKAALMFDEIVFFTEEQANGLMGAILKAKELDAEAAKSN